MKTVKKEVDFTLESISTENSCFTHIPHARMYTYVITSHFCFGEENINITKDVEVPETIKEAKKKYGLSKDKIVDVLNNKFGE